MLRRCWCRWFHKRYWSPLDSQCYDEGDTSLIQLIFDRCEKCNLYFPSVYRIAEAGSASERLV